MSYNAELINGLATTVERVARAGGFAAMDPAARAAAINEFAYAGLASNDFEVEKIAIAPNQGGEL